MAILSQSSALDQIGDNPFLPEDIIRTILKRLPVKSLIQFQCVCKDWKNLLKTPSFITEHLHHSMNENPLLLLQWGKFPPMHFYMLSHKMQLLEVQPSFPLMDSSLQTEIVGCSNGLLCVRYFAGRNSPPSLSVCNPATREIIQVPSPIKIEIDFCALGFGFSPIDNDYKILVSQETYQIDSLSNPSEVYSLRTGSWKEIKVDNFGGLSILDFPVTTVNGAMFWFGKKVNMNDNVCDLVIVSFDMEMEVFTLIPPPCDDDYLCESFLNVYENKLAMLSQTKTCRTNLWVMEEGARSSTERWSWSKKYSINTSLIIYPRCIWLDQIVYHHHFGFPLSFFDLTSHEWVDFDCRQRGTQHFLATFDYAESLTPVSNIHP